MVVSMLSGANDTKLSDNRLGQVRSPIQLKFIASSGKPLSTRERELQDQDARSHAAKISHTRKRKRNTGMQTLAAAPSSNKSWVAPIYPGFGGFRHEVYVAFSEEYSADLRPIVDYWIHAMTPRYDLFTEVFDIHHPLQFFIRDIGKHECVLAGLSAYALVVHCDQGKTPQSPPQKVLSQRYQAVERLREQLEHGVWGETTPVAIIYLAILASILGEPAGVRKHLYGLKILVGQMGGLDALQWHVRSHILLLETGWSLKTGKSLFKRKRSWNPIYPIIDPLTDLGDIPPGFRDLVKHGRLSVDVIIVIQRLARATLPSTTYSKLNRAPGVRFNERAYDDPIECCPVLFAPDSDAIMLEKMLCFTLILYCTVYPGFRGRQAWYAAGRQYLQRTMPLLQPTTEAEYKCLAWMYIVTIDSYRYGYAASYLYEEGNALLVEFAENFQSFRCNGWEQFETVLQTFFWTRECSAFWKSIWADLPSRSMKRTVQSFPDGNN